VLAHKGDKNASDNQTKGSDIPGVDGVVHDRIKCYHCQRTKHYSSQCPDNNGADKPKVGHVLNQNKNTIKKSWVLIDSCSTHSMSNNRTLVKNLRKFKNDETLVLMTNASDKEFNWIGDLTLFPLQVHFDKQSIATILSLKDVGNIPGVSICMDTRKEKAIIVTTKDGTVFKFLECLSGLYYYDSDN